MYKRKHLWGSIKYSILLKLTKDSTHLHNNKIMYHTHPKVIPWGWTNKQTDYRGMDKRTKGQLDKYLLNIQG
jgi:hypothetical protein